MSWWQFTAAGVALWGVCLAVAVAAVGVWEVLDPTDKRPKSGR